MKKKRNVVQLSKFNISPEAVILAVIKNRTLQEAADEIGRSRPWLWAYMKEHNIQERIGEIPKEALAQLQLGSYRAAGTLIHKLDNPRESLQAATEILDRVGVGKSPQSLTQINVAGNISDIEFVTNDTEGSTTQEPV